MEGLNLAKDNLEWANCFPGDRQTANQLKQQGLVQILSETGHDEKFHARLTPKGMDALNN